MSKEKQRVVVLGASDQPEKYAGKAVAMLLAAGHEVLPVNPQLEAALAEQGIAFEDACTLVLLRTNQF